MLMTLAGARHETKLELINSLRVKNFLLIGTSNVSDHTTLTSLHETVNDLKRLILSDDNKDLKSFTNKFLIANKLVLNHQQSVEDSFRQVIESTYESEIDSVGKGSLKSLIDRTNQWASDLTNKKIQKILDDDFRLAALALINLVYFNYEWKKQFDETLTQPEKFYTSKDRKTFTKVDMMKLKGQNLMYTYSQELNAHFISLSYKRDKYHLNIVLPADEQDFLLVEDSQSLINRISHAGLKAELKNQEMQKVDLKIPKFSIKKTIHVRSYL